MIFVADIFDVSGDMNNFLDGRPVSWKRCAASVQDADLFAIFRFRFSVILFFTGAFYISVVMASR